MTVTFTKKARSPAYPFVPLSKALERAKEFYVSQRQHPAPLTAAVSLWGYSPKSSGGLQTIAALKQFGLMEDDGSGKERLVKLTDLALRILRDQRDPSPERDSAIREAALMPKVHAYLRDKWGPNLPTEATVTYDLVQEKRFTEAAAKELTAEYRDTIAFAKLIGTGKVEEDDVPVPEFERTTPEEDFGPRYAKVRVMEGERELTTGLLSKDASFRLIVSGQIGVKEIERLIQKLEFDKAILAENEEGAS